MINYTSREKQKTLLHMLISEITIDKERAIDSINLIEYLSSEEALIGGTSSFLMQNLNLGE